MSGEIEMRLAIAREQAAAKPFFDHVIANDDAERAADELYATMSRELGRSAA